MSDDGGVPGLPQNLWQSQAMDWLRVTFKDLHRRAQTLEDLVRTAAAGTGSDVTGVTGAEAGRRQVDLDSAAWSLAVTVANTPRPPLPPDLDPQPPSSEQRTMPATDVNG